MAHTNSAKIHFVLGFLLLGGLSAGFGFFIYSFVGDSTQEVAVDPLPQQAERILDFWFGSHEGKGVVDPQRVALWKDPNAVQKELIQQRFKNDLKNILNDQYGFWALHARGRLSMILVLDEFSGIIGDEQSRWRHHKDAVELSLTGIRLNQDTELSLLERAFFYQPLLEAESLELQNRAFGLYENLRQSAPDSEKAYFEEKLVLSKARQKLIYDFGRFPDRNAALGRETSAQEKEYLDKKIKADGADAPN